LHELRTVGNSVAAAAATTATTTTTAAAATAAADISHLVNAPLCKHVSKK
jgi:hypothetical protein